MRVLELRQKAFLSQAELAERSGLSVAAIQKIEYGKVAQPYGSTIRKLATALGVEPDALIVKDTPD